MIKVEVLSQEKKWSKKIKKTEFFFNFICKSFPKKYRFSNKKLSLTLLLSNNKNIKKLNNKFRNKNKTTDVLSFPFNEKIKKNSFLGDVVISYEIVKKRSYNSSFSRELDKMWVHGLLHLLGYNHKKLKDYSKMYNKEKIILKKLEIIN